MPDTARSSHSHEETTDTERLMSTRKVGAAGIVRGSDPGVSLPPLDSRRDGVRGEPCGDYGKGGITCQARGGKGAASIRVAILRRSVARDAQRTGSTPRIPGSSRLVWLATCHSTRLTHYPAGATEVCVIVLVGLSLAMVDVRKGAPSASAPRGIWAGSQLDAVRNEALTNAATVRRNEAAEIRTAGCGAHRHARAASTPARCRPDGSSAAPPAPRRRGSGAPRSRAAARSTCAP